MPPVIPNPAHIREFKTEADFERWLARNHANATEVWIKMHKKASGLPTITYAEALDVALCWGWIDGIRKSFDDTSFLQRYSPRKARSIWSKINTAHIARLTQAGRMQPPGNAHVEMAKADGRWDAAYSGSKDMQISADLAAALKHSKAAQAMYDTLSSQNRYALSFRLGHIKTEATRAKRVLEYIAMLERGETIYPNKPTSASNSEKAVSSTTTAPKIAAKKAASTPKIANAKNRNR